MPAAGSADLPGGAASGGPDTGTTADAAAPPTRAAPVQPPAGRARRRPSTSRRAGFVLATYAFVVTMLGTTLPTPIYPLYRERFGFSQLMVTVVFATYAVGVIAALLLFGRLSDQVGRRRALLPGLLASAASAAVFLLADNVGVLLVGRVLSGLSAGVFTGTATATLLDLAPPHRRGRATLVATIANMGGLGCGPLLAGLLSQYAPNPLRLTFVVDLALLVPAAVGIWLMPETVEVTGPARPRPQRPRVPPSARSVFVGVALAAFAGFAVLGLYTAVAPAFLGAVLDPPNRAITGLVVFAVFASSACGQASLDVVTRRLAAPGRPPERIGLTVGCAGLVLGMGVLALGLATSSVAGLVIGGVISGASQGIAFRAGLAAVNAASPADRRAEAASAFFVVAYVALSLPVVGVGLLVELTSLTTAGLVFAAIVAALAIVVLALLRTGAGAAAAAGGGAATDGAVPVPARDR
ncbi:MFS transporter [Parafrankia soli]|uniref:MFS transporter n=1 Tax=Parafrankia soli TaxID=2599596 RepID=A0A1S1Q054_9ACTN|nr:MFS transporter [Parafrankia soli]OHV28293.1 MFS transporter [Parafrankia soli]